MRHESDSIYSFPVSDNEVEIRLLTKKDDDIAKVELIYNDKYVFHKTVKALPMPKVNSDDTFDYYVIRVKLVDKRFAYVFRLTLTDDSVYYFSESGVTNHYDITKGFYDFFQVSFINDLDVVKRSDVLKNRVFYQIFVDRFCKDPQNENPRINIKWGNKVKSTTIAGGTLKGVEGKLDYLMDLGIDALYLTPVFEADSNHKYDTIDYYKVSSDFGDETDLLTLIAKAHERGMIILLDGVFNHVSSSFFAFRDVVEKGVKSAYYDWFFIKGKKVDLKRKNYATFAYCKDLPRLNLNNRAVQDYIIEVGTHYVKNCHIDGFRLDVSDEIPHAFWIRFKEALKEIKDDVILLGENWHNASSFLNSGFEFDSIMNYAFTKEVLDYVAVGKTDAATFKNRIVSDLYRYKSNVNRNLLNLLSSHDIHRFLEECQGNVDRYLIGYALLFAYVGIPCVYYGDEIGIRGGYDPLNRACFVWDEGKWDRKIHQAIRKLIEIRKKEKMDNLDFAIDADAGLLRITRKGNGQEISLCVNLSGQARTLAIKGATLIANNCENGVLANEGFVMIKEELNHEKL